MNWQHIKGVMFSERLAWYMCAINLRIGNYKQREVCSVFHKILL